MPGAEHLIVDRLRNGDRETPASRILGPAILWLLSILVGVVAGLGAVVFRALIAFFHDLLFLGRMSLAYDANTHTPPSPWGPFVILVPVFGSFGVAFLVKNFAPEAKGHGVPEVMDAVYNRKGVIRPVVSVVKALASALSIGSGGSIGREGPIIQIGASFGSSIGQLLRLPAWQIITLIAAGAGGGIAATFNTPVGGVLFAVEIVMHELSVRTLVPVVSATATATYIGQLFFGTHPSFIIPAFETVYFHLANPLVLLAYGPLGAITGLTSALFIYSLYGFESFFERYVKAGYYVQHAAGMLIVGILIYSLMSRFGHYYVEGVGYATIQDVLSGIQIPLSFLVLLFGLKLLATSLTLGSGASGGVFSPSLFLGAIIGTVYGAILHQWFPSLDISPPAFAVAGMAGVVGGATGAAMAAIVMIFEMTLDYGVILPMTMTVAISYAVRRTFIQDSIYTRKLTLRGERVPDSLRADLHFTHTASGTMNRHLKLVPATTCLGELKGWDCNGNDACIVTSQSSEVLGVITCDDDARIGATPGSATVGQIAHGNYVVVAPESSLWEIVEAMHDRDADVAIVASKNWHLSAADVQGIITRKLLMDTLAGDMELFYG